MLKLLIYNLQRKYNVQQTNTIDVALSFEVH